MVVTADKTMNDIQNNLLTMCHYTMVHVIAMYIIISSIKDGYVWLVVMLFNG